MRKVMALMILALLAVSPCFAILWQPDTKVVDVEGQQVKGKEADVAVYSAANAVNEQAQNGKVKDATVKELNETVQKYHDQRDIHPGLGIGGAMTMGGKISGDLLFSLRKGSIQGIVSVGYGDLTTLDTPDLDLLRVGVATIYEF